MSYWLRIDGYAATEIAAHTAPTWETLADGGCGAASWEFALSPRSQHSALRVGALVEVMAGPQPVYRGLLTEPDRTTWECHAYGLSSSLRQRLALDAFGNSTRDLGVALAQAIERGWRGTNPAPVVGVAAGDPAGNPVKVGDLLDDYAEQTGQRWGADAFGRVYMRPDPTTAKWLITPDVAAFGVTDEAGAQLLAGRYFNGTANLTAYAGGGEPEEAVDLTDRGTITAAAAEAILNGQLARRGGYQWTNGATLSRDQITTAGGTPAALGAVTAGQMVRAHGLGYGVGSTPWLDVTIGKTRYTAGDDVIYLEPINTAPRTFVDVVAAS